LKKVARHCTAKQNRPSARDKPNDQVGAAPSKAPAFIEMCYFHLGQPIQEYCQAACTAW